MATGHSDSGGKFSEKDIRNCSICLEQFKKPKNLPCLHTFCEACLNAYIISSSKGRKSPPEHFNCPVCRAEVKPPDPTASVEDWASLMPVNRMLNSLKDTSVKSSSKTTEKIIECDPCKFDGENITGEFWCFECQEYLCNKCKKEHVRHKSSRNHKLVPANESTQHDITVLATDVEEPCLDHKGDILRVYCVDHRKMCCVLCLSINHRKCENIKTFDEMAEIMNKTGEIKQFSDKMKEMNSKVERISSRKRENITSIQKQQTAILNKADDLIQKAKSKLDECHQELKDHVSCLYKEQTTKLLETADKMDIFQNSLTSCQNIWNTIIESGSPKQIFVTFEKIKERLEGHSEEFEVCLKEDKVISLDIKPNNQVIDMGTLTTIAEVEVSAAPSQESLSIDMGTFRYQDINKTNVTIETPCIDNLEPVKIWEINDGKWFSGGTFLSDGRLLLVDYTARTLTVCNDGGKKDICHSVSYKPWDAVQHSDDSLYVSSDSDSIIREYMLSCNTLQEVKCIRTNISHNCLYAINITLDNHVLVEMSRCIYVMTMDGTTMRTIKTSDRHSFIATSTSGTESVFYYCDRDEVVCQYVSGKELLRYKIPDIKGTRGIAVDKWGNIYVCGKDSSNVYVVSQDRKSSRVLLSKAKGVFTPYKIGFDRTGSLFFLTGFENGKAAVYKLEVKK